ncbi:protocadherin-10b isoform X2 [Astyanax mexicanus]|uniref:protocadherin-10b isoform X2 n=1 Tax=Astyanax mexicanus TaxID=7994 RepID=UPI000769CABB|nr:protocadherin-10b isoform X2 [Astyanax mexicanus]
MMIMLEVLMLMMRAPALANILLLLVLARCASSQLRYSVAEESELGTFVGNIAEDLGLDATKLSARRFQTVPSSRTPYLDVNLESGALYVSEKIDRERVCGVNPPPCLLHLEVFLEDPLELFRVETEVLDINDNPPTFPEPDVTVEISESASAGTRFPLEAAVDPDVGSNGLRAYEMTPNAHFHLDVQTQGDGSRYAELVLDAPLDRERQAVHRYVLTAVDGGQPARTGTALLVVRVLDSNDNAPVFDQPVYAVTLRENAPVGTLVIQLNATDSDEGANGEVVYALGGGSHAAASRARELFDVDARTGRVEVRGDVDYEESALHQIYVQARDLGPNAVPAHCKVLVHVTDVNDNAPEITFSTVSESVSESAQPGTVIALLSVSDRDADENGRARAEIVSEDAPFKLKPSFRNYYTVVTDGPLDRETADAYTVTVVARDGGTPPLATSKSIRVRVADENDNAPEFTQPSYDVHVAENNVPGAYIYAVSARDADDGSNARVTYSIAERDIQGMSVVTYVSVNAENGYLYALRSFDYEQLREFSFTVRARDAGTPELASNVTVRVLVVDQNDNAPAVIAPVGKNGTAREPLPRTAEPGYLVTRVVAADADDGENARLSYSIVRGNEDGLFRMDWRTGELRTARRVHAGGGARSQQQQQQQQQQVYELLVEVRDHGQPPLSCSTLLQVALVDSLAEGDGSAGGGGSRGSGGSSRGGTGSARGAAKAKDATLDLTLILIVALGSVSFIFLLAMIALAVRCRKDKKLNVHAALHCCCSCGWCCGGACAGGTGGSGGAGGGSCCGRHSRSSKKKKKKKLSKSDIMLVQSGGGGGGGSGGGSAHNVSVSAPCGVGSAQVPVEESGSFGSLHRKQNYCYQVCLSPEAASTDLMFLKACSPSRGGAHGEPGARATLVSAYGEQQQQQQPDIISNGGLLSSETKHQRAELSYLVDRPRRVNSSAFQEADIVSSKDSGHGDSEQGDSDHDATHRGHSSGADLFSNCTEECKALGHSDRCWMPSFVPTESRQGADYRSNLHVPGMDAVPDTERGKGFVSSFRVDIPETA